MPIHVVQRGNNRSPCFLSDRDFRFYLQCLRDVAVQTGCRVHAYVLMTNHVHLLLTPVDDQAVSQLMQRIGRRYVREFNERHARSGTLWEGRFRSSVIDSERYFLVCQRYIEHNPVRARMVTDPGDYPWSSHRHYADGVADPVVSEHACFQALGNTPAERQQAYREFCARDAEAEVLDCIRTALNKGRTLGTRTDDSASAPAGARLLRPQRLRPQLL